MRHRPFHGLERQVLGSQRMYPNRKAGKLWLARFRVVRFRIPSRSSTSPVSARHCSLVSVGSTAWPPTNSKPRSVLGSGEGDEVLFAAGRLRQAYETILSAGKIDFIRETGVISADIAAVDSCW